MELKKCETCSKLKEHNHYSDACDDCAMDYEQTVFDGIAR